MVTSKNQQEISKYEHDDAGSAKRVVSANFATRIDETTTTDVTYVGKAVVGSSESDSVWQIQKVDESGSVTVITFADGDTEFDNVWDDRASLSYS